MTHTATPHDIWTEQLRLHEQARALAPGLRREAVAAFSWQAALADTARAATRLAHSLARHRQRRVLPEA